MRPEESLGRRQICPAIANRAEEELVNLVRSATAQNFSVTISRQATLWIVEATDRSTGLSRLGEGETFAEAWLQQEEQHRHGTPANDQRGATSLCADRDSAD